MKKIALFILLLAICLEPLYAQNTYYPQNPSPLLKTQFIKLPLGAVTPDGWLKSQLQNQAAGLTGHLDEFWPDITNSGWQGKTGGDTWEATPYYLDGLVPLAYILNDSTLIAKIQPFIEYILFSRQANGWFGPGKPGETWPLAVACKALTSYYEATRDARALALIKGYFNYLYNTAPDFPDGTWRGVRAMEHAVTGLWLYKQTGDPQILETLTKIHSNSRDWTAYYETFPWDSLALAQNRIPLNWEAEGMTAHVVNNAMAIKYPGLWFEVSGEARYKNAVYTALKQYDAVHGQVGGRFSGDEHLNGHNPTHGSELCSIVESMYSLENLLEIFGDVQFADRLELLAYNALPGTMTPDCWAHQYDQQSNQVLVSVAKRNWSTNGDYSNIYGLMPNYSCCLANMHQGWPKFVEHLWMATNDNGLAAIAYGPSRVSALVGNGQKVTVTMKTNYPFDNLITLKISAEKPEQFPVYLRIPAWAESAVIQVNGEKYPALPAGQFTVINRQWSNGDSISLELPFKISFEKRFNKAVAVKRGPLYFSLRIEKSFTEISFQEDNFRSIPYMGSRDWQITPESAWNYGLTENMLDENTVIATEQNPIYEYPFADRGDMIYYEQYDTQVSWQHEPPVTLQLQAKKIPSWGLKDNSADVPPVGPVIVDTELETVTLVPYGCARLRISEFPLVK